MSVDLLTLKEASRSTAGLSAGDAQRVNDAFDSLIASLRPAPAYPTVVATVDPDEIDRLLRPPAATDAAGLPHLVGGGVLRGGLTARIGRWYVSAPTGTDLFFVGTSFGPSPVITLRTGSEPQFSHLGIDFVTGKEHARYVTSGVDAQRVNAAFDKVIASLRPAP